MNPPLDASCDNATASQLGYALSEAARAEAGDSIDRGLALLRILRERDFEVRRVEE